MPSVFEHVASPVKRRTKEFNDYSRRKRVRVSRLEAQKSEAARVVTTTTLLETDAGGLPTGTATEKESPSTCCAETQTELSAQLVSKLQHQCQYLQNEKC